MPKLKAHSGSKKRFKKISKSKIKRSKAYKRHHAWAKTKKQKVRARKPAMFSPADEKNILTLLPY